MTLISLIVRKNVSILLGDLKRNLLLTNLMCSMSVHYIIQTH
jgi:hypothetical protein